MTIMLASAGDGVALIRLARPHRRNALDSLSATRLAEAIGTTCDAKAIVVTGAGSAFCSGDDLYEISTASADRFRKAIEALQRITLAILDAPVPVIAAINGAAMGAGLELTLACDLRIAATTATFGCPEVRWGLTVTNGASVLLPDLVGAEHADSMIAEGRTFDAQWALAAGLVHEVVPGEHLIRRAALMARGLNRRRHVEDRPRLLAALSEETRVACGAWHQETAQRALAEFRAGKELS
ncbi:enoyl-CoA hydratase/isomerase family protein [Actinomadura madurae]|uniref:enoyl-CoA hydratase/isomerase family protein n=1 Tax=Actinomadura madurae TaxID=1993 RepID=UPI00399C2519